MGVTDPVQMDKAPQEKMRHEQRAAQLCGAAEGTPDLERESAQKTQVGEKLERAGPGGQEIRAGRQEGGGVG